MVQKSDDDVNRALAAFSAPSIPYRNFTFRPLASVEPTRKNPPTGGFRLLAAAIPEAAGLALSSSRALPASPEADVEALPEQALPTKNPHLDAERADAPAPAPRTLTGRTNPGTGTSGQQAPAHRAPDTDKTSLAAVFSALNADRLQPAESAEAEQKLQNIFSML